MEFWGFIAGLILLAFSLIFTLYSTFKKKSYVIPIILLVIGFALAFFNLLNIEYQHDFESRIQE
ncbi:hypothetical protein [Bacillus sp. FJAT-45350]|uniref:hypothetical protein n=1 Tax=Bacillus sp. FJAT-45350 TaxID=2011014 RepID=UPI000BB990AD|nr:hypothetical protein [Bacillus sp. FJAT-45350]